MAAENGHPFLVDVVFSRAMKSSGRKYKGRSAATRFGIHKDGKQSAWILCCGTGYLVPS